jgi:hypothetical protein
MKSGPAIGWDNMFGQTFSDYNACHRLIPNLKLLPGNGEKEINYFEVPTIEDWSKVKGSDWPAAPDEFESAINQLPVPVTEEIEKFFGTVSTKVTPAEFKFLEKNLSSYQETNKQITKLVDDGFLVTGVPIKLQSLAEKKMIISNFDECVNWYNEWVVANNFGKIYSEHDLTEISQAEEDKLNSTILMQLGHTS